MWTVNSDQKYLLHYEKDQTLGALSSRGGLELEVALRIPINCEAIVSASVGSSPGIGYTNSQIASYINEIG